jgi:acyl-CoA reductase-like NAD-dependent aldehyde dehydrogenase
MAMAEYQCYRNAPYILGTRGTASAIAAGNTVVFKGSETSPRTHWAICSLLQEAGLPNGVLNYVVSSPKNAAAVTTSLIANPEIKKLNFTGSTAVGRIIAKTAGEHLKPVLLELGGKAPAIICEDADVGLAASTCAAGSFAYAGQVCMSTERILVHKDIRAEFEAQFKAAVEKAYPASDDALVLINEKGVEKSKKLLKDAQSKGASFLLGDVDAEEASKTRMRPIIVTGVKPDMDLYKTESFGPSVSVIEFDNDEEAIRIANDTEYGLNAAVYSNDLRRAMRLARRIEAGSVHINRMTVHDEAVLPHGGVKSSGFGRFNAGLEEWVRTKTVTYDL